MSQLDTRVELTVCRVDCNPRKWPNARACNQLRSHLATVGRVDQMRTRLVKWAHLAKCAAHLVKWCTFSQMRARAFGWMHAHLAKCAGQMRAHLTKRCAFGQMSRVLSIGQMRSAFTQMRCTDWSNAPYIVIPTLRSKIPYLYFGTTAHPAWQYSCILNSIV